MTTTSYPTKAIAGICLVFFMLPLYFFFLYESNLHCTQYTSFRIAFFDIKPHIEERDIAGDKPAYVYQEGYAIPLRLYLSLSLVFYMLLPGMLYLIKQSFHASRRLVILIALSHLTLIVNTFLPKSIVGERILWLNIVGLLWGSFLYLPFIIRFRWHSSQTTLRMLLLRIGKLSYIMIVVGICILALQIQHL